MSFSYIPSEDLRSLLQFHDPETGNFTCVGDAPSKGRRCHNPIASHNQKTARSLLDTLPQSPTQRYELWVRLLELAKIALCKRNHQDQFGQVAARWYRSITTELETRQVPQVFVRSPPRRPETVPRGQTTTTTVIVHEEIRRTVMLRIVTNDHPNTPSSSTASTHSHGGSAGPTSSTATSRVGSHHPLSHIRAGGLITPPLTPPALLTYTAQNETVLPNSDAATSQENTESARTHSVADDHDHHDREDDNGNNDTCEICFERYDDPQQTPCGHIYCRECITTWLEHNNSCPHDRRPLFLRELLPVAQEDKECNICYEESDSLQLTSCGHLFCRECISTWLREHTCPYDRRPLRLDDLVAAPVSHRRDQGGNRNSASRS